MGVLMLPQFNRAEVYDGEGTLLTVREPERMLSISAGYVYALTVALPEARMVVFKINKTRVTSYERKDKDSPFIRKRDR